MCRRPGRLSRCVCDVSLVYCLGSRVYLLVTCRISMIYQGQVCTPLFHGSYIRFRNRLAARPSEQQPAAAAAAALAIPRSQLFETLHGCSRKIKRTPNGGTNSTAQQPAPGIGEVRRFVSEVLVHLSISDLGSCGLVVAAELLEQTKPSSHHARDMEGRGHGGYGSLGRLVVLVGLAGSVVLLTWVAAVAFRRTFKMRKRRKKVATSSPLRSIASSVEEQQQQQQQPGMTQASAMGGRPPSLAAPRQGPADAPAASVAAAGGSSTAAAASTSVTTAMATAPGTTGPVEESVEPLPETVPSAPPLDVDGAAYGGGGSSSGVCNPHVPQQAPPLEEPPPTYEPRKQP